MPASAVACPWCQEANEVAEKAMDRPIRCRRCASMFDAPRSSLVWTEAHHALFQHDRFSLRFKIVRGGASIRNEVLDEQGELLLYAERSPSGGRPFLGLVALIGVLFAVGVLGLIFIAATQEVLGQHESFMIAAGMFVLAIPFAVAVYISMLPKRDFSLYRASTPPEPLLEILQDNKIMLRRVHYTVRDSAGNVLGRLRKNLWWDVVRNQWHGYNAKDELCCWAYEDSPTKAVWRMAFGGLDSHLTRLLQTNFVIREIDESGRRGDALGEFDRKLKSSKRYVLDLSRDADRRLDRRLAVALAVLLDLYESNPDPHRE